MAALTTSEIKIDGQILSHIPVLVGQSNYSIWHVKICNTLSAYRVWEIVEGTNTYAGTLPAVTISACPYCTWQPDHTFPGLV